MRQISGNNFLQTKGSKDANNTVVVLTIGLMVPVRFKAVLNFNSARISIFGVTLLKISK